MNTFRNFTQQVPARFEMPHSKILPKERLDRCFSSVKDCVEDIISGNSEKKLEYFPGLENIIRELEYEGPLFPYMKNYSNFEKLNKATRIKKDEYLNILSKIDSGILKEKIKKGIGSIHNLFTGNKDYPWEGVRKKIEIDGFEISISEIYNLIEDRIKKDEIKHYRILQNKNTTVNRTGLVAYYIWGIDYVYNKLDLEKEKKEAEMFYELGNLKKTKLRARLKASFNINDFFQDDPISLKGKGNKSVIKWKAQKEFIKFEEFELEIESLYKIVSKFANEEELFGNDYFVLRKNESLYKTSVVAVFIFGKIYVIRQIDNMKKRKIEETNFLLNINNQNIVDFRYIIEDYKNLVNENGYFISLEDLYIKYGVYIKNSTNTVHNSLYREPRKKLDSKNKSRRRKDLEIDIKGHEDCSKYTLTQKVIKEFAHRAFGNDIIEYHNDFQEKRELLNQLYNDKFDFKELPRLKLLFSGVEELIGEGSGKSFDTKIIKFLGKQIRFSSMWAKIRDHFGLNEMKYKHFGDESSKWLAIHLYGEEAEKLINSYEMERQKKIEEYDTKQQQEELVQQEVYDEELEEIDPKQEIINSLTKEQLSFIETDLDDLDRDWIIEYRKISIEKIRFIADLIKNIDDLDFSDFEIDELNEFHKKNFKGIENYIRENF